MRSGDAGEERIVTVVAGMAPVSAPRRRRGSARDHQLRMTAVMHEPVSLL
jgi:hypothetical protein